MSNGQQRTLPISLGIREAGKRAGTHLLEVVREVVRGQEKQEAVARILGISPELLSQALRAQRTFNVEWLPALFTIDHDLKLLRYLAWQAHCRVTPVDPFNDGDYRKAADAVLNQAGPLGEHLRQQILEAAQLVAEKRADEGAEP